MTMRGIDISSYQRGLDVSVPSVDFCIVKSTEGTYQVQDTCDPWVQRLIELGRLWGFYHVMSSEDGTRQADFFLKNCINYFRHGIPILDIEGISSRYPNNPGIAYDFCKRVIDETGVVPMVYMNSACLRGADWTRVRDLGCGLWIANYYRSGLDYYSADPSSMMSDAPRGRSPRFGSSRPLAGSMVGERTLTWTCSSETLTPGESMQE